MLCACHRTGDYLDVARDMTRRMQCTDRPCLPLWLLVLCGVQPRNLGAQPPVDNAGRLHGSCTGQQSLAYAIKILWDIPAATKE